MIKTISIFLLLTTAIALHGCASDGNAGYGAGHHHGGGGWSGGGHGGDSTEGGDRYSRKGIGGSGSDLIEPIMAVEHSEAFSPRHRSEEKVVILGTVNCELWTRALNDANQARIQRINDYKAWVYGYLSGLSAASSTHPIDDTDAATVNLYVTDYCRGHPGDSSALAAQAFARERITKNEPTAVETKTRPEIKH